MPINLAVVRTCVKQAIERIESGREKIALSTLKDLKGYLEVEESDDGWVVLTDSREINLKVKTNHTVLLYFVDDDRPAIVIAVSGDRLYLKRDDRYWWYDYKSKNVEKVVYR